MPTGLIYKAINLDNGKVYIGQTARSLRIRVIEHKYQAKHRNCYFNCAFRKYPNWGWQILTKVEAPTVPLVKEYLDLMEELYINEYKSYLKEYGYNLMTEIKSNIIPKESIEKAKEKIKNWWTEERRKLWSERNKGKNNPFYGKRHSEEFKKRMSELNKGRKMPREAVEKRRSKLLGRKLPPEVRKKISEGHKGLKYSEEHRRRIREGLLRVRDKISQNTRGENNPMYGKHHSEETKRKISESLKKYFARLKESKEKAP